MHGVNLDQLGRRDPSTTAALTLTELELQISADGRRTRAYDPLLPDQPRGRVRRAPAPARGAADGIILNPGSWTHYSYAIRDALEIAGLPAVEIHLSDVEPARRGGA